MAGNWRLKFVDPVSEENKLERMARESFRDILEQYDIPKDEVEPVLLSGRSQNWYKYHKEAGSEETQMDKWRDTAILSAMQQMVKSAASQGCILVASYIESVQYHCLINQAFGNWHYYGVSCAGTGIKPIAQHKGDNNG